MLTCILNWMQTYSGALTFLITVVYVIATVLILRANKRSADLAKEQLDEMKLQFFSSNRPILTADLKYIKHCFFALRLTNNGPLTAFNVKIILCDEFLNSLDEPYRGLLLKNKDKTSTIGVGQSYDVYFGDNKYLQKSPKAPLKGQVIYNGVDDSVYAEDFSIDMESRATFFSVTSETEDLEKKIDEHTKALNRINNSLQTLIELQKKPEESEQNKNA